MPPSTRGLADPEVLAARLADIAANPPHIAPLNNYVRRLRIRLDDAESVPWFDPASGGIDSQVLFLLEAPGARSVSATGLRVKPGSGIISPDNNDATAANLSVLRDEVGLDRSLAIHWNVVPWYIGDTSAIRPATKEDILEALPDLRGILKLLPSLRVVVTMGRAAQIGWGMFLQKERSHVITVPCVHPSPRALNSRPEARPAAIAALRTVVAILESSGVS